MDPTLAGVADLPRIAARSSNVGRVLRPTAAKTTVNVHDYVDVNVPVLARMHDERRTAYAAFDFVFPAEATPRPRLCGGQRDTAGANLTLAPIAGQARPDSTVNNEGSWLCRRPYWSRVSRGYVMRRDRAARVIAT